MIASRRDICLRACVRAGLAGGGGGSSRRQPSLGHRASPFHARPSPAAYDAGFSACTRPTSIVVVVVVVLADISRSSPIQLFSNQSQTR